MYTTKKPPALATIRARTTRVIPPRRSQDLPMWTLTPEGLRAETSLQVGVGHGTVEKAERSGVEQLPTSTI